MTIVPLPRLRSRGLITLLVLATVLPAAAPAAMADAPLATVAQNGDSVLCTNGQQSTLTPGSGSPNGVLTVVNGACATSSNPTSPDGGGGGAPSSGGGGSNQGAGTDTTTASNTTSSTSTSKTASRKPAVRAGSNPLATVQAAQAAGVKIALVRYRAFPNKRLGVTVLVRDRKLRRVRNSIVTLSGVVGARTTLVIPRSTYTNRKGVASFVLPLASKLSGRRLLIRITARTPHARVFTIGSRRVPATGRS